MKKGKGVHLTSKRTSYVIKAMAFLPLLAFTGTGAVTGNIQPAYIEIDYGVDGANLYPSGAAIQDWVKDSAPNIDVPSLNGNIATGIIPGLTGAQGGAGHWYGVRIVDGIAGN